MKDNDLKEAKYFYFNSLSYFSFPQIYNNLALIYEAEVKYDSARFVIITQLR